VKTISQIMFNKHQKLLLKFQRKNVLDSDSTSSDSDNNDQDVFKLMEHKDQILRTHILEKMLKAVEIIADADRPKSEVDLKLMQGVFYKRLEKEVKGPQVKPPPLTSRKRKAKDFLKNMVATGMPDHLKNINNINDNQSNLSIGNISIAQPGREQKNSEQTGAINIFGGENNISST